MCKITFRDSNSRDTNDFSRNAGIKTFNRRKLPLFRFAQSIFEEPDSATDAKVVNFGGKKNFPVRFQARVKK